MNKLSVIVTLVSLLAIQHIVCGAGVVIPPDPPQTTSLKALISAIDAIQEDILSLRKDLGVFKIQVDRKLEHQHTNLMVFLVFFQIGFFSLMKLCGRFYDWFMFRRFKRRTSTVQESILLQLEENKRVSEMIMLNLSNIQKQIQDIDSDVDVLDVPAENRELEKVNKKSRDIVDILIPLIIVVIFVLLMWIMYDLGWLGGLKWLIP